MSSTHTLPVNIFNLEGGETMLAQDKGNFQAPGENRTRDPALFCQQVDDWTLLKITEKIIQRKRNPGTALIGLRTTTPSRMSIAPVKQKVLFTRPKHSGRCLLK